ncbi:MAG: SNF2-related protein [Verrucomicrobiota bacterium JB022]|nr:SNF2-related protein [Verrucomicrobiota bacterium JB022]
MWDGLPDLSKNSLVDLAGWTILRAGQDLRREGAVRRVEWNAPHLTGEIRLGGRDFRPTLNLRSLAFAENRCTCGEGRRGYMCEHALALCVEAERRREAGKGPDNAPGQSAPAPKQAAIPAKPGISRSAPRAPESAPSAPVDEAEAPQPTWLKWEFAHGRPLELQVHLPPNLADSAPRDAIMVKLVVLDVKRPKPLEQIVRSELYKLDPQTAVALGWLERWAHGRPASLLQLKRDQLRTLLQALAGKPNVFFVNQPNRPLRWDGGKLPEINHHLGEPERAKEAPKVVSRSQSARGPLTSREREEIIARSASSLPAVPREGEIRRPAKDPVAERRRRLARITGQAHVHSPALEAYRARAEIGQGAGTVLEVDGSEHFLSVRLPSKDDPRHYQLAEILKNEGFRLEASNGRFWLRDRHKTLNFLARYWVKLEKEFDATFTQNFQERTAKLKPANVAVDAARDGRDYRITLRLDAGDAGELEINRALSGGRNYVESPNGDVSLLNPEQLEQVARVQRKLMGQQERPLTPRVSTTVSSAACRDVESILEELDAKLDLPQDWTERSTALKQVGALKAPPLPPEFAQRLRVYQQVGVAWLWHLYRHDLGGILADEMGLGKTIQALGLILCRWQQERNRRDRTPSVVVSPAGLTENWKREAAKFAPQLRVFLHHGNSRLQSPEEFGSFDLIITSYQTLVRDQELFNAGRVGLVIADEAQHIKNRRTMAATALRSLQVPGRMVLTGTPIENSVDDLRSILSFILPGYLAKIPDGLKGDDRAWYDQRHLQQAAPYILRRSKKLVAAELPEKIEQVVPCDLSPRQRELYEQVRIKTEQAIFEMEMSGAAEQKVRFAALTQLLRLRQACVDPRLVNEEAKAGDSAKLAAFREILEECLDGGHRILVFSQFTQALKLLQQFLQKRDINHLYLDGSTKNRASLCERFNKDESIPVFLISLKAGGTGLNLTGADTVVHYDPWWNPAVEAQATDRAHRIGQTRVVTSYKLITTNTVEEKVLELQERKAGYLQDLLDESAASTAKVSLDDIRALLKG